MEQLKRLQSIEREMLSEGKSSSEIDAFKATLRRQQNAGTTPQMGGVASLSETARNMNRGPRGIAVYMDRGGDPSVVRLGGRRTKNAPRPVNAPTRDGNQSMALTNEDIETLVDFTPFFGDIKGGADGAEFIKEELKRDNPNFLLMGIVGGAAVVGVVPILGDVAQKLIMRGARNFKKDRVTEETLSMLSEEDAIIVQDLTNKTPETDLTESEILADSIASDLRANKISRVTDERLEDLDFKGEIRLRQHYIDGNVGVDADGVPITLENRQQRMIDQGYDPSLVRYHGGNADIKALSADMGEFRRTETGFFSSDNPDVADSYVSRLSGLSGRSGGQIYPVVGKNAKGLTVDLEGGNYNEISRTTPVIDLDTNTSGQTAYDFFPEVFDNNLHPDDRMVRDTNELARAARSSGYSHVNFLNTIDRGPNYKRYFPGESSRQQDIRERSASSPSNVRVEFDGSNVRVPTAVFDPRLTKLKNIGMADGGAVMQGVGSLNETARNMSRGPRGIAGYQQFADGGELNVNLRALDLPVDGRMSYTQTDDGGRFDSEIRKTFEGGLGSLTPSFDYSTQNSSRNRGDLVIDEDGEQIGFALEGELFLKPQSEDKVRGAFAIEKSRNNTNFTFPEGEFVETREGLLKRFNLGMDLGNFGIDLNRTEASGREPVNRGSATIRIGENGIVRYSDSDRGEPNIEFNYSKQFADGGPVYMTKGGEGKEEGARQQILNTIYGVESNNNYNAWNTSAKNPPQKDLTSLTVKEIMDYQGNNNGPAAGAGQIKFDTLSYLINAGTLSEDDLFTAATQDVANNKLLDRRGFNSWLSGDLSDLDFGDNIASEWASIPLLSSMTTPNGVEKERGDSRYGGSNKALLGADVWENVLYTAKGQSKTPQIIDDIVLAEAYTPEKLVSEVMAGSPTYMTDESSPLSMAEKYPQSGPLDRVERYPLDRVERYPLDRVERYPLDRVERYPEKSGIEQFFPEKQMELKKQESLYEKYSPKIVQDALLGLGYFNSVGGPNATNR